MDIETEEDEGGGKSMASEVLGMAGMKEAEREHLAVTDPDKRIFRLGAVAFSPSRHMPMACPRFAASGRKSIIRASRRRARAGITPASPLVLSIITHSFFICNSQTAKRLKNTPSVSFFPL